MKKFFNKKNIIIFISTFILLFLVHLPLITKNIITGDVLLNNYFYNGYSWEISLGRFGLYVVGIIKSFFNFPHIDLIISYILISSISVLLINLFDVKSKINKAFIILIMGISPIISSNLIFNYCSIGYLIAFIFSILSLYFYINIKNKYFKYLVPIILIVTSLSMYQAYLSCIVTVYALYFIKYLLDNKKDYKSILLYIPVILIGVIVYFILMKLSLAVFHINMSNYSNADSLNILSLITSIPSKIIDSYFLFINFFFSNDIMKNTYFYNHIINFIILIMFIGCIIYNILKNDINRINIVLIGILIILMPILLNSVIFVINDSKLQLLMSSSYLILFVFIISNINFNKKFINYICLLVFGLLLRNYLVQVNSSYLTLENTFNRYYTIIGSAINNNINDLDKKFVLVGNIDSKLYIDNISKSNYGYISDESIFWDEFNLRSIAFKRFCFEYYGVNVNYVDIDTYNKVINYLEDKLIYNYEDNIVINLSAYR